MTFEFMNKTISIAVLFGIMSTWFVLGMFVNIAIAEPGTRERVANMELSRVLNAAVLMGFLYWVAE